MSEPYVTRAPHWRYPAGMSVLAERVSYDCIRLQYQDGTVVEAHGHWYLEGLERKRQTIWEFYAEEMAKEIDEQVLKECFALAS